MVERMTREVIRTAKATLAERDIPATEWITVLPAVR